LRPGRAPSGRVHFLVYERLRLFRRCRWRWPGFPGDMGIFRVGGRAIQMGSGCPRCASTARTYRRMGAFSGWAAAGRRPISSACCHLAAGRKRWFSNLAGAVHQRPRADPRGSSIFRLGFGSECPLWRAPIEGDGVGARAAPIRPTFTPTWETPSDARFGEQAPPRGTTHAAELPTPVIASSYGRLGR